MTEKEIVIALERANKDYLQTVKIFNSNIGTESERLATHKLLREQWIEVKYWTNMLGRVNE